MSTGTLDRADVEIVELPAGWLNDEVGCEFQPSPTRPQCGAPARWRIVAPCPTCRRKTTGLLCPPHRVLVVQSLAVPGAAIQCLCGTRLTVYRWDRL